MKLIKITLILVGTLFATALIAKVIHQNNLKTPIASGSFSASQQVQIEKIVHDYIISNPEILVEASKALQQKQMLNMTRVAVQATKSQANKFLNDPVSPVAGNPNGDVTLIAFLDYQCTHCRAMTDIIASLIQKNPNLRVVFKEFPIFGADSERAARYALAANQQHEYFKLHEAFMHSEIGFSKHNILKMAKKIGLNTKELINDSKLDSIKQELKQNYQLAEDLKLVGTPAFVITKTDLAQNNNQSVQFVPGQTDENELQTMIDQLK